MERKTMEVQPRVYGQDSLPFPVIDVPREQRLMRALRKMSSDPYDSRTFSQAKIMVPAGIILAVAFTTGFVRAVTRFSRGENGDISEVLLTLLVAIFGYIFLANGLWRRFGVDRDKVWTRFGTVFYREVRFDEVTRFDIGTQRYKLWDGKTTVNIDYNRFDYSLAYFRIIEELHHRRFELPGTAITDPDWEDEAQAWRNTVGGRLYAEHKKFFDAHPDALSHLNAMIQPPDCYDD